MVPGPVSVPLLTHAGTGTWALPGGKLSVGETWFECAERETLEETSLKIKAKSFVAVTNDIFVDEGKHFVTLYILCEREDPSQQPVVGGPLSLLCASSGRLVRQLLMEHVRPGR